MSFRVMVLMFTVLGIMFGEIMFWVTGDVVFLVATLIILFTNIPNLVRIIKSI